MTDDIPVKVEEQSPTPTPRIVPYWTYLIPVFIAFIGMIQVVALAYLGMKVDETNNAQNRTTGAIVTMEKQINSNMERQIRQAIGEAIANERTRVAEKKEK